MSYNSGAAILLLLLAVGSSRAFEGDSAVASGAGMPDPVSPDTGFRSGVRIPAAPVPLSAPASDTLSPAEPEPPSSSYGTTGKLQLIKRTYNSRQQVLLATGMMIFVVGIMTLAQQWNPR
jgi:hypothetical protein